MRRALLLGLCLLLCAGCAAGGEKEGEYRLYYVPASASHGAAVESELYDGGGEGEPDPGELMQALLDGPASETLSSPFPRWVSLRSWEWDPETPGNLKVNLSEQYSGLTDISLTLADYCIVLTLSQLEGVETVEISAAGRTMSYRSHQQLSAGEAVLP